MSINPEKIVEQVSFRVLIGEPSLLQSEDRDAYEQLRAGVEREIKPQTIFDEIRVQEITDKFWEEQRLKRQQIALIQSAKVDSLASLLTPYYGDEIFGALETARNYYSGDQQRQRTAQKIMEQLGVTEQQVEANGIHVRSIGLLALDRMVLNRETSRNRLIRDHERRQRRAEKAKRRSPVNDN
jgi:hypothetical protein